MPQIRARTGLRSGTVHPGLVARNQPEVARRSYLGGFLGALLITLLAASSLLQPPASVRAVGPSCTGSTPPSAAYTVTVCITAPVDGTAVTGDQTVTGTVSVTAGTSPGVIRTVFFLRGAYLLTDFASPYTFSLLTSQFVDGSAVLEMEADMKDGYATAHASMTLSFNNGVTTPPVNTGTFTPRTPTPSPGQPLVVAAAGDGASGEPNATNATNLIAGWNPDMVMYLGDVYEKGTSTEFRNWYGDSSTYYGRFKSKTNPVIGNHEYEAHVAPGYF